MEKGELELTDLLKLFAPGTSMRTALNDLIRARMGALVVINKGALLSIVDGGFRVNSKFSSQKLVELAKMDGAIVISDDFKKILYANALLSPDVHISTKETGTRHKAAERTSKQMKTIVIAVSERKNKTTIYYGDIRYELEESSEILRRATETLQILEKQKEILDDLLMNLNVLEINNIVTISDVCRVLQRLEMVRRISDMVKRYLIELGKAGTMVSMRLKELVGNLSKERKMILQDYFKSKSTKVDASLESLNFDILLETANLSKIIFEEVYDKLIFPQGIRLLSKTHLSEDKIQILIDSFRNLENLLKSNREDLLKIMESDELVDSFKKDFESLKERIMDGKKV